MVCLTNVFWPISVSRLTQVSAQLSRLLSALQDQVCAAELSRGSASACPSRGQDGFSCRSMAGRPHLKKACENHALKEGMVIYLPPECLKLFYLLRVSINVV